jgi:hypothetical protein
VAELVDALDLGSSFFGSEGSSPFIRILKINIDDKPIAFWQRAMDKVAIS